MTTPLTAEEFTDAFLAKTYGICNAHEWREALLTSLKEGPFATVDTLRTSLAVLSEALKTLREQGNFDNGVFSVDGASEGEFQATRFVENCIANLPTAVSDHLRMVEGLRARLVAEENAHVATTIEREMFKRTMADERSRATTAEAERDGLQLALDAEQNQRELSDDICEAYKTRATTAESERDALAKRVAELEAWGDETREGVKAYQEQIRTLTQSQLPEGCIACCRACGVPYDDYTNGDRGARNECTFIVDGRDAIDGAPATCPIRSQLPEERKV